MPILIRSLPLTNLASRGLSFQLVSVVFLAAAVLALAAGSIWALRQLFLSSREFPQVLFHVKPRWQAVCGAAVLPPMPGAPGVPNACLAADRAALVRAGAPRGAPGDGR